MVIVLLVFIAFVPTLLQYQGLFWRTKLGLIVLTFFVVYGLTIYRNFPFQTASRLSEAVTIPFRLLAALIGGFMAAFTATHLQWFNIIVARVFTGFFASAIEGVCIFFLAMYTSMMLILLLKRRQG
ncbi:MAG: hypothetical protein KC708_15445 [Anaerolineae bacterium]|nr:hypothetical protein [Anaerolineae bacterium]